MKSDHIENINKTVSQGTEKVGSHLSVTVIGLGPMGKAIVSAFLDKGYGVTVWNRTLSKADDLMAKGAMKASTVSEAITSYDLIILSLTDYRAMYAIFEPISEQLTGKVIVNLSSDTPEKVREASEWLANATPYSSPAEYWPRLRASVKKNPSLYIAALGKPSTITKISWRRPPVHAIRARIQGLPCCTTNYKSMSSGPLWSATCMQLQWQELTE